MQNTKNASGKASAVPLRDWNVFVREIAPFREINGGRLQSRLYFEKIGRYDIANAITYHKGMNAINKGLGIEKANEKLDVGDYRNWKLFEPELRRLQQGNCGALPTKGELEKMKKYSEINAIAYHGGFADVRIAIGEKPIRKTGRRSLSNLDVFASEFFDFSAAHGNEVKKRTMEENKRSDLANEVRKRGGLKKVQSAFGLPINEHCVKDMYPSLEKLSPALHALMRENGFKVLPSCRWEGWKKYTYEYAAIGNFGGFEKVREKIGPAGLQKTNIFFYRDWKMIERYMKKIIGRQKRLPPLEWLAGLHQHQEVLQAIYTHHGDLWEVRLKLERMGATPSIYRHPDCRGHSINEWKNLLPVLMKIVEENHGLLPSRRALRAKYPHVANAIDNNGGMGAVRKKLIECGCLAAPSSNP